MKAYPVEFQDLEREGLVVPKGFIQFCMSIRDNDYKDKPNIDRILSNALRNIEAPEYGRVQLFLKELVDRDYEDAYLRSLFRESGANLVFERPTQIEIVKRALALSQIE